MGASWDKSQISHKSMYLKELFSDLFILSMYLIYSAIYDFSRSWEILQESERICETLWEYARTGKNQQEYAIVCKNL